MPVIGRGDSSRRHSLSSTPNLRSVQGNFHLPCYLGDKSIHNTRVAGFTEEPARLKSWLIDQWKVEGKKEREREGGRDSRQIQKLTHCVSWRIQLWREREKEKKWASMQKNNNNNNTVLIQSCKQMKVCFSSDTRGDRTAAQQQELLFLMWDKVLSKTNHLLWSYSASAPRPCSSDPDYWLYC